VGGRRPTPAMRFDAPVRDRPFGHCEPRRRRRSGRVHAEPGHQHLAVEIAYHRLRMIDRTPLLRFLSPSALARHVARMPGLPGLPAVPLRPFSRRSSPPSPLMLRSIFCTHAVGGVRWPLRFSLIALCRKHVRPTRRGSTPRLLVGCCGVPRRVAASGASRRPVRVMHRRFFAAGVPLPAGRFTWPGRAPFGGEAFLGFRPVIAADTRSTKRHACDGVRFRRLSRRRSWGSR
jgi:hypothetical protein